MLARRSETFCFGGFVAPAPGDGGATSDGVGLVAEVCGDEDPAAATTYA